MIKDLTDAAVQVKKFIDYKSFTKYGPGVIVSDLKTDYLVMFKRENYKNFQYYFPEVRKANNQPYGHAQIMSKELLFKFTAGFNQPYIVFATPDGVFYKTPAMLFKKFYEKHKTDVPHLSGEIALPLDFFERLEGE